MKQYEMIDTLRLPHAEFSDKDTRKRQVRVVVSPETTGEQRVTLVHCVVPPGAVSEGHVHADYDEYIQFQIAGEAVLDGRVIPVPAQGVLHARAGQLHECRNTSKAEDLFLTCVFVPPLKPYGMYPQLMDETRQHLEQQG